MSSQGEKGMKMGSMSHHKSPIKVISLVKRQGEEGLRGSVQQKQPHFSAHDSKGRENSSDREISD